MLYGYLRSMLARRERYGDAEFRRFLRRYQRSCLLMGKARATAELEARQAPRWSPGSPPSATAEASGSIAEQSVRTA